MGGSAVYFFRADAEPFMRVMGVLMLGASLALVFARIAVANRGSAGEMVRERNHYLRRLTALREQVRVTASAQRAAEEYLLPEPGQLWAVVAHRRRLWERRPSHEDFLQTRIGLSSQQLATPIVAPRTAPLDELEPFTAHAMGAFIQAHAVLDDLPMAIDLRTHRRVTISGDPQTAYGLARAMVAQLVALHSPEDLVVAVAADPDTAPEWEWCKWLPHLQHPVEDGAGAGRLIATDLSALEAPLTARFGGTPWLDGDGPSPRSQAHLVIVLDGEAVAEESVLTGGVRGVTVIELAPGPRAEKSRGHTGHTGFSLRVSPHHLSLLAPSGNAYTARPDQLSPAESEALARQLAPLRLASTAAAEEPLLADLGFAELLGIDDPAALGGGCQPRPRSANDLLRVPIGVGEDGQPVRLDLKEAALGGMGPHGLCVGATGSGKSEVLRTLVLALAVTHPSETLNFVLADFKGGATFAGLASLAHVSSVITNLADDLPLVDRAQDALSGELRRRQELLRSAGNYASRQAYERAREAGAPLHPLPSLLIIVDEFSELLAAKPQFLETFLQIGRIGRSLGVHLLLATQRLEADQLRGLDTHLSYRLGLRTFSAGESRTAIGVPDAHHLPAVPGSGFLVHGTDARTRFKAAYVSGPYVLTDRARRTEEGHPMARRPVRFTAEPVPCTVHGAAPPSAAPPSTAPEPTAPEPASEHSVLDVLVRQLADGLPAHPVWLPPLDEPPALRALVERDGGGSLTVPLGLVDLPYEQRQGVLRWDFSGAGGHALLVGGPRSGKSTLLRTLITSFSLTHSPDQAQFYCLDFGGGGLSAIASLPHVGSVAGRLDVERVRRTVDEVAAMPRVREEFQRRHRTRPVAPDVFLVVDNWAGFREQHEELEPRILELAHLGLGFGVHLVISAHRHNDLRPAITDHLLNRLELRLSDPLDSEIDRRQARNIPRDRPGRGLSAQGMHVLTALPDEVAGTGSGGEPHAATRWRGARAPGVRLLPTELRADELTEVPDAPSALAFALGEPELVPVGVDFGTDPFFVVYGDGESGKSNVLRLLAQGVAARWAPHEALVVVADYRRGLLGGLPESHVLRHTHTPPDFAQALGRLTGLLRHRMPDEGTSVAELRSRDWWNGPQVFVLVDDYELVATRSGNPLEALTGLLPFARDIGLRVVVARSSNGAARSAYEPVLLRMKELDAQGLVLSGDPYEGPLLRGVAASRLAPGRGSFVSRRGTVQQVQTAWQPWAVNAPRGVTTT